MKKNLKVLRTLLLLLGVAVFVFATVGESIERADWTSISGHVDGIAEEMGFESYDAVDDEAVRAEIEFEARVIAAQETVAVEHGYKKFSKVDDENEIAEIKAKAREIATAESGSRNFGDVLADAWVPLLIVAIVMVAAALAMIVADRPKKKAGINLTASKRKNAILRDQRVLLILVIIALVAVVGFINPKFVKLSNIIAIFQQISVLGILTMVQAMLLISGGIDLSIGNMMALVGVLVATLLMNGCSLFVAILGGVAAGTVCGLFNGVIISKSRCMPLIITLGTGQIFYGVSLLICGGSFLQFKEKLEFMRKIQLYNFLPLMVIFMLAIVLFMYFLLNKTKFGRRIVAIGGNEKNAFLSGINVDAYKIATYAIGGAIVSIAALILGARLNSITATAGDGYETDALVAAIIGGVTFEGGRGTVFGAFLGCLLTGIISNALDILGVHAYVKVVISGAIIVGAVVLSNLDNLRKKR